MKVCCICGRSIKNILNENNPEGAMWRDFDTGDIVEFKPHRGDVCCNECNTKYVLPGRLYKLHHKAEKGEQ